MRVDVNTHRERRLDVLSFTLVQTRALRMPHLDHLPQILPLTPRPPAGGGGAASGP